MSITDLPGSSLLAGRYRLVERLGAGGMSVVWRGFDEVLGRQVAVKVLPPSTSAGSSFRRRLRAEAQAAARLSHPHITSVHDYGEALKQQRGRVILTVWTTPTLSRRPRILAMSVASM
jgi:eukaryotic-like serine/threonine-protein kinase